MCREQNIDIVSPIGSGFVDTPVLKTFLPSLCRQLMGTDLLLENHPVWWCGNTDGLQHAITHLRQLTVASAMDRSAAIDQSADLQSAIKAKPAQYMVSAPFTPSVAPAWDGQGVGACLCFCSITTTY